MKSNVICPYCKTEVEINWESEDANKQEEYKCYKCKKNFYFTPEISDSWFDAILGFIIILGIIIGSIWIIYFGISKTISFFSNNDTSDYQKQQDLIAQQQYDLQKAQLDAERAKIQAETDRLKKEIAKIQAEQKAEINTIKQYTSKVLFDDSQFRTIAKQISQGCNGEQECQLYKIYRFVVTYFEYYSDPRNSEYIQSPTETWNSKGGDCEDLGIILQTLLESVGIKTYSVFTTNHYYVLGCISDSGKILEYTNNELNKYDKYYDKIHYYSINNLECVPLEPTAGDFGYPGHFTTSYSEAYDPLTLNKVILT